VVGAQGLVDDSDDFDCGGVVGCVLVYWAWWGVEVYGGMFPFPLFYLLLLTCYQLFIGVMSSLYSVWDICDDLILRKVNSSDASVFAKRYGGSSQCWGVLWSLVSLLFMIAGILAGLAAFKQSFEQQEKDSQDFISTRLMRF
jgi:hypothetical protein